MLAEQRVTAILQVLQSIKYVQPLHVFDCWLEAVEITLRMVPQHRAFRRDYGRLMVLHEEPSDVQAVWGRLAQQFPDWPMVHSVFTQAFALLVDAAAHEWYDWLGTLYMRWELASRRSGQFFTPWSIALLMAELQADPVYAMIETRLAAALSHEGNTHGHPYVAELAHHMGQETSLFFAQILPAAMPYIDPVMVADCACGSGVLLLALASQVPLWANVTGVICYCGQDIDARCVRMARIQAMLYGLQGAPIRTLSPAWAAT